MSQTNTKNVLTNEDMLNKLDKFKTKFNTTQTKEKDLTSKINSLTEINKNVTDSYNVSLKIIVDVTKLLNQYMIYFNEIDKVINSLNESNSTLSLANNYFDNINKLTSEKIDQLSLGQRFSLDIFDQNKLKKTPKYRLIIFPHPSGWGC